MTSDDNDLPPESNLYLVCAVTTEGEDFTVLTKSSDIVEAAKLAEEVSKKRGDQGFVCSVEVVDVYYDGTPKEHK